MLRIFTDPALHTDPSDIGSDTTQGAAPESSPTSPIIGKYEDYPVFDSNMVAERASVYSSAISDDADNDAILLPNARSMIDEVMSKIKQIPSDQLQKHWQMASYAHIVQIADELVREITSCDLVSMKTQMKFQEGIEKKLDDMQRSFTIELKKTKISTVIRKSSN